MIVTRAALLAVVLERGQAVRQGDGRGEEAAASAESTEPLRSARQRGISCTETRKVRSPLPAQPLPSTAAAVICRTSSISSGVRMKT